ncbi:MAG: phosphatase PAP2 family protein, partial [Chloroflexi bacterium]|nr:phosphatase PAP2 family protein [Chloroflexota bacterium]
MGTFALYILAWAYPTFPGDESTLVRFQSLRTGWLDDIAKGLADFGVVWVFLPLIGVLTAFLLLTRRFADAAMVFAGLFVIGIGNALKVAVDRPRPDYQIFAPFQSSLSFPSGHSLLAVILGGLLIYLIESWVKPVMVRRAIQAGLVLVVIALGASRGYMGVHWPSDGIGSYAFGILALVGVVGPRNAGSSAPSSSWRSRMA